MKLSEDRINSLAYQVAFELKKKRLMRTLKPVTLIQARVEKPMLEYFALGQKIDEEAHRLVLGSDDCPPEGSYAFQARMTQKREELAARYNYEL